MVLEVFFWPVALYFRPWGPMETNSGALNEEYITHET
jgi:hypothetical protein